MSEDWKRLTVAPDSEFFPILQQVIKQTNPEQKEITVNVLNKKKSAILKTAVKDMFKFVLDWDGDQCGIEVFRK
jgi:hypothetical protein